MQLVDSQTLGDANILNQSTLYVVKDDRVLCDFCKTKREKADRSNSRKNDHVLKFISNNYNREGNIICKMCFKAYSRRLDKFRTLTKNKTISREAFLQKYPDINSYSPCPPQVPQGECYDDVNHVDKNGNDDGSSIEKTNRKRKWKSGKRRLERQRKSFRHVSHHSEENVSDQADNPIHQNVRQADTGKENDFSNVASDNVVQDDIIANKNDDKESQQATETSNDETMEAIVNLVEGFLDGHPVPENDRSLNATGGTTANERMKIGTVQYNDTELLQLLKEALEKEKNAEETDLTNYGSVIINMLNVIAKGTVDHTSIGFHLNASYWRRLTVASNRMRYRDCEKEFWTYMKLMCHEQPIRLLSGTANYGAGLQGEIGSQRPEDANITLAIPSLNTRKHHISSSNRFEVCPGFIKESFETLKKNNVEYVNIGIDEKTLAEGVVIETQTDENGIHTFHTCGDVDYYFEDINQKRDKILGELCKFYNRQINQQNLDASLHYLQTLYDKVQTLKETHTKAIGEMRKKDKQNTATLPRLVLRQKKCIQSLTEIEELQSVLSDFVEDFELLDVQFKTCILDASHCLLQPATHIAVVMANNLFGRTEGSHTDSVPLLYIRSGTGVKVDHEYKFIIDKTRVKLHSMGITVVNVGADTAMQQLLLFNRDGKPSNLVGLKNKIYSQFKKKSEKTIKKELANRRRRIRIRFDPPDYAVIENQIFPELGDIQISDDVHVEEVIGVEEFQRNIKDWAKTVTATSMLGDESDKAESAESSDSEGPSSVDEKKAALQELCSLIFKDEKEAYRHTLEVCGTTLEIFHLFSKSEDISFYETAVVDPKHSGTRIRANAVRRDILTAHLDVLSKVAETGATQLSLSDIVDKPEMQSDQRFCQLFSRQTEAICRHVARVSSDYDTAVKFESTANTCRFLRIYFECITGSGIKRDVRLRALAWCTVQLYKMYKIDSFDGFDLSYKLGVHNHTFQGIITNINATLVQLLQFPEKQMNPKALGSAWNEYFFSTLVAHADHDNTALKATKIDSILSRAILARVMEMNNAKRFTYLHSKAPIYKAQHMEEEGNASEENPQNLLPFKSSFNFPKKRTHSYQIKNVANVRHFHRPDPGNQYRSLTESIER